VRREWDPEDLIACWTLVDADQPLVGNKRGPTRLGFALMLKFFELEARFLVAARWRISRRYRRWYRRSKNRIAQARSRPLASMRVWRSKRPLRIPGPRTSVSCSPPWLSVDVLRHS
jgi:hypothetical protein